MKEILLWITAVGAFLGLMWALAFNGLAMEKTFAPKFEQVRRNTFEQSKAYNEGMAQELGAMQIEYVKATPEQQAALSSIILHRVSGYDQDRLPADLRQFVQTLKSRQGMDR